MSEGSDSKAQGPKSDLEPWMRGTHAELDPVVRAVVHALELAQEDVSRWCGTLSDAEMFARPGGVAPVAFHLRHIARSLDRLLTYAEGRVLNDVQLEGLRTEMDAGSAAQVIAEFRAGLAAAKERVQAVAPGSFAEVRGIGRKRLPTTVVGLLIHCAEHTARHVGQAVTTAKIVRS
jgi:hypothetical protein